MKVKQNRTFGWYLEHGMVFLTLILLIFYPAYVGYSRNYTIGVNRTIGRLWDISNIKLTWPFILGFYTLGFLVLKLLKRSTDRMLSAILLIILVLTMLLDELGFHPFDVWLIPLGFCIFLIIFLKSLIRKKGIS